MLTNQEGKQVPNVKLKVLENQKLVDLNTEDIFKGKRVIVFALPGAYTPTCSSAHLPRYNELAPVFFKQGIDEIVCLSVNDPFVMAAWAQDQKANNVRLVADGNGEFSEKIGMLVDKSDLGFGKRSWRYSMYVEDGIIKKMFIEPEKPGDPFEVSDADTMLNYLYPGVQKPLRISMISKRGCPHCARAKSMLTERGLDFEEIELGGGITQRSLFAISGAATTPQVFIDGKKIGGADELAEYLQNLSIN
ncbi:MAG: glutathione peroxidase [Deltaproteobacteria bacterium]|nr:glutathione peroxidase [Deltaproteobacteria bacterium]